MKERILGCGGSWSITEEMEGVHILLVAAFIIQESDVYGEMFKRLFQSSSSFSISGVKWVLNIEYQTDLFCLHYVFLSRINAGLDFFRLGWNSHSSSTEGNNIGLFYSRLQHTRVVIHSYR